MLLMLVGLVNVFPVINSFKKIKGGFLEQWLLKNC